MKLYIPAFSLFKSAADPLAATVDAAATPEQAATEIDLGAAPAAEMPPMEVPAELPDSSADPVQELKELLTGLLAEDNSSEKQEVVRLEDESDLTTEE